MQFIRRQSSTADVVRDLADRYNVKYSAAPLDRWATHVTRLAGDDVDFDEVEQLIVALQRFGHLSRKDALLLQAQYLHEITP